MAFNKTPMQDTDQNKTVPLMYEWESRSQGNTKDTEAYNVVFELIENSATGDKYFQAIKRDGSEIAFTISAPDTNVIGTYFWRTGVNNILVVVGNVNIYRYNLDTGALMGSTVATGFHPTNSQNAGFTEFLYENGTVTLIITDSIVFGELNVSGTWTLCVDADRPSTNVGTPVFLDGYLFLADTNSNIYNSDLNNPQSWTASNFIQTEAYADRLVGIARAGNYIVALGETSTEWFYDAANPTGTPLARVDGATKPIGMVCGMAINQNRIYFIGRSEGGSPSLFQIDGLKIQDLGTGTSKRWLNNSILAVRQALGNILSFSGHQVYVINPAPSLPNSQTYMYDLETGIWSKLFLGAGTTGPNFKTGTIGVSTTASTSFYNSYISEAGSMNVLKFSPLLYQDSGVNFPIRFTTRPFDFGTNRKKFGSRLLVHGDQTSTTSLMSISWSDNDYQTFSTPRTIDCSGSYKQLYALGSFRKRAFRLTYSDNFPMRWQSIELDYSQGQT